MLWRYTVIFIEQRIRHYILQHLYDLAQCQGYSRNSMFPLIKYNVCIEQHVLKTSSIKNLEQETLTLSQCVGKTLNKLTIDSKHKPWIEYVWTRNYLSEKLVNHLTHTRVTV